MIGICDGGDGLLWHLKQLRLKSATSKLRDLLTLTVCGMFEAVLSSVLTLFTSWLMLTNELVGELEDERTLNTR
jgi:hypothetical protein